jgi:hypothetical protein
MKQTAVINVILTSIFTCHDGTFRFVKQARVVGIAIRYGLDGPGIDEIFNTSPDRPWRPPGLLYNECRFFSVVQSDRDMALLTHPDVASRLKKE